MSVVCSWRVACGRSRLRSQFRLVPRSATRDRLHSFTAAPPHSPPRDLCRLPTRAFIATFFSRLASSNPPPPPYPSPTACRPLASYSRRVPFIVRQSIFCPGPSHCLMALSRPLCWLRGAAVAAAAAAAAPSTLYKLIVVAVRVTRRE